MMDKKVYAALVSLRGNPDFALVMSWVKEEREQVKEKMVLAPVERVQLLQGAAIGFNQLLEAFEGAPEVMKRMNTA